MTDSLSVLEPLGTNCARKPKKNHHCWSINQYLLISKKWKDPTLPYIHLLKGLMSGTRKFETEKVYYYKCCSFKMLGVFFLSSKYFLGHVQIVLLGSDRKLGGESRKWQAVNGQHSWELDHWTAGWVLSGIKIDQLNTLYIVAHLHWHLYQH